MVELTDQQLSRYARQLILPEIDLKGQQRLLESSVLIVGAGGLGCPLAQYLCGAGVGRIRLADDDRIELSNLPRQVAFSEMDIGRFKVEVLAEQLSRANGDSEINPRTEKFNSETAAEMLAGVDLVIDATDSLQARLDIDRTTWQARLPWIKGSAVKLAGQWAAFDAHRQFGCYHCVVTEPAGADTAGCTELGILGPIAGLVAMQQSVMAIKILLGLPVPWGELHVADAWTGELLKIAITKRGDCPLCLAAR
jgi:molybdopterin/thiamine biosynthesis adenylyltransferase